MNQGKRYHETKVLRAALLACFFAYAGSAHAEEQEFLPPGSVWEYTFDDPSGDSSWTMTSGGWSQGAAPFGTARVIDQNFVAATEWQADGNDGDDLWVRKTIDLMGFDLSSIRWFVGVDNGYTLYVNGELISKGNAEGYTYRWEYSGAVPREVLKPGRNIVALALEDHGGEAIFDMAMTGSSAASKPQLVSVEIVDPDSLEPIPTLAVGESFRVRLTYDKFHTTAHSEKVTITSSSGVAAHIIASGEGRVILSDTVGLVPLVAP